MNTELPTKKKTQAQPTVESAVEVVADPVQRLKAEIREHYATRPNYNDVSFKPLHLWYAKLEELIR